MSSSSMTANKDSSSCAAPEGFQTVTPTLVVDGAAQAIETYKKALGATELYRMPSPDGGKIMHACLQIGSSKIFLSDVNPEQGRTASTSNFYVYLKDVDGAFKQAKQSGLQETAPLQDQFWGDRTGSLKDRFGNQWTLATHVRDVSQEDMQTAMKKMAGAKAA